MSLSVFLEASRDISRVFFNVLAFERETNTTPVRRMIRKDDRFPDRCIKLHSRIEKGILPRPNQCRRDGVTIAQAESTEFITKAIKTRPSFVARLEYPRNSNFDHFFSSANFAPTDVALLNVCARTCLPARA